WRKDNLGEAELGAGQLPIVGRAVARRHFVVGVRLLGSAQCLGGAPSPISGAGKRDWIGYARADAGKMLGREPRVVEEAQRDPAGRELLVDPVVLLGGPGGVADDLVGGPEIARVEQFARQQAALDPPFIHIPDYGGITRRAKQQR